MKTPEQQKRDEDWSLLANQVVGAETCFKSTNPDTVSDKRVCPLAYEQDPEMAFDDELGWMHKDSLAVVNELRAEVERSRKMILVLKDSFEKDYVHKETVAETWKQAAGTLQTISWSGFGVEYERGWNNAVLHNQKVLLAKTGDPNAKAELGMMPTTAERDLIRKCVEFVEHIATVSRNPFMVDTAQRILSTARDLGIKP